ncbi:MAG: nitroreductase family protein [Bacteriovorax sp.]|nr:nitroreductase family protein [Bacteriovorax sp.]
MEFLDVIHKRHSIRQFDSKEIDVKKLESLLQIISSAPSAGDLQSYELVLVKDQSHREALAHAALGQEFIHTAPVVLVFCANADRAKQKYGHRGEILYSVQDATIAATYAQLAAVELGLATTWVGAFDEEYVRDIVGELKPICIMPIGYPAEKPEPTPRRPIKDITHYEHL